LNCQALAQQLQGNLTVKDGSKLGISSRYLLACVKQIIICNSSYASTWFSRKWHTTYQQTKTTDAIIAQRAEYAVLKVTMYLM